MSVLTSAYKAGPRCKYSSSFSGIPVFSSKKLQMIISILSLLFIWVPCVCSCLFPSQPSIFILQRSYLYISQKFLTIPVYFPTKLELLWTLFWRGENKRIFLVLIFLFYSSTSCTFLGKRFCFCYFLWGRDGKTK